jgi:hypothetical protein
MSETKEKKAKQAAIDKSVLKDLHAYMFHGIITRNLTTVADKGGAFIYSNPHSLVIGIVEAKTVRANSLLPFFHDELKMFADTHGRKYVQAKISNELAAYAKLVSYINWRILPCDCKEFSTPSRKSKVGDTMESALYESLNHIVQDINAGVPTYMGRPIARRLETNSARWSDSIASSVFPGNS